MNQSAVAECAVTRFYRERDVRCALKQKNSTMSTYIPDNNSSWLPWDADLEIDASADVLIKESEKLYFRPH